MDKLINKIDKFKNKKNRLIIGIDGRAASGKSTLAKYLKDKYNCTVFRMDDFFLTDDLRTVDRLSTPGENIDHSRMYKEVFSKLSNSKIEYKKYNCNTKAFEKENETVKDIVVIEGVYALRPEFMRYYDITVFVDVDKSVQLERLKSRNESLLSRFVDEWLPMEEKYFTAFETVNKAEIIIKQ